MDGRYTESKGSAVLTRTWLAVTMAQSPLGIKTIISRLGHEPMRISTTLPSIRKPLQAWKPYLTFIQFTSHRIVALPRGDGRDLCAAHTMFPAFVSPGDLSFTVHNSLA